MATRATVRTVIRTELNDSGGTPLWPDANLNQWILEALRRLGRDLGREVTYSVNSTVSVASYALPTDCLEVLRVEHPTGFFRRPVPYRSGDLSDAASIALAPELQPVELSYDVWAGNLILQPAPDASGEAIGVRYRGAYTEPANDATVLDVATRDEDALTWLVVISALEWIGLDEGKRQRFERQRGSTPQAVIQHYERRYRALLQERRGVMARRRLVIRGES